LIRELGISEQDARKMVGEKGLRVYTTIDLNYNIWPKTPPASRSPV